ncbi:MAG: peptidase [Firmicutes bacterium]|nr:peptidase [Bacillota bacterium]
MNDYYYNQLNKEERQAYHAMLQGLSSQDSSFAVPRLSPVRLSDLFFMVRMDHPELFYAVQFTYRYYDNASNVEFFPAYLFDKKKRKGHIQAMDARLTKLARPAETLSEREKLIYIHDFICSNVTYDKLKKEYSHEIIGPLGTGVGVCEGIAKTVKALCDRLDLWCIIALCDNNPQKGIKYRHMWNVVKVEGKYYHLDVTFDNSLSKKDLPLIRYDYFLLCDQQIGRDHEPPIYPLPPCTDGNAFFYMQKKLSFTKIEEAAKRAAQYAKKQKPFVFHWRGGYLTKEVLQELLAAIEGSCRAVGKQAAVSLNWPQAVLCLTFSDIDTAGKLQQEPLLEQANEGELYEELASSETE